MTGKHRDAAAYELGVLDDPEEFETHLRDCPRCRDLLTGFTPVTGALAQAARLGYLPPSEGAGRRRKPCVFSRGSALLLLALMAVTAVCVLRPATGGVRFASAACIVSPARVVAGTGHDLRDPPWSAGFQ